MSIENLTIDKVKNLFEKNNYIADENISTSTFLSLMLKKPILIEGPPGVGKTELSKAISTAFNFDFFRVQCFEGITYEQIIGEWNYQKQLLALEESKIDEKYKEEIFSDKFFIKRPLLSAFMNKKRSVILIDEIDKADEEVESFLLQALGEKQITVNDLGTFYLQNDLVVVLTSNSQRILLDETKDRCLFLYIDYPSPEREKEIILSKVPEAPNELVEKIVALVQRMRQLNLIKKPSIRASIDWVKALLMMGKTDAPKETLKDTINLVVKTEDDKAKVLKEVIGE